MKKLIYYAAVIGSAGLVWSMAASATSISTTRSNIKSGSAVVVINNALVLDEGSVIIISTNGNTLIIQKTRHDTVKNSINNIR